MKASTEHPDRGSNFSLTKWYMDLITPEGSVFIGYAATLRWRTISCRYFSILTRNSQNGIHADTSLSLESLPSIAGSHLIWTCRSLRLQAEWIIQDPPVSHTLLDRAEGTVSWSYWLASARSWAQHGNSPRMEGLGYVERLDLSILPWRIPIDELQWGRFLGGTDSVVWLRWKGEDPILLLYHNLQRVAEPDIRDSSLEWDQRKRLQLTGSTALRNGEPLSTRLLKIPGISAVVPQKLLKAREFKWLSRGTFQEANRTVEGWAIHESVHF